MKKSFKTLLTALLCLTGLNARADVTPVTPSQDGDGVYQIGSAAELLGFANLVNGDTSNRGASAVLTTDINMAGATWTPICDVFSNWNGKEYGNYSGTFDGQGHTIDNLVYSTSTSGGRSALIANVSAGAVIKNLTMGSGCSFTANASTAVAGAFVGYIGYQGTDVENTTVTLLNLVNNGTVTASHTQSCAGGIVGWSMTGNTGGNFKATVKVSTVNIEGCTNNGTISSSNTNTNNQYSTGGIVGYSDTPTLNITSCVNTASVTGVGADVAGIIGKPNSTTLTVTDCRNEGAITSSMTSDARIGGIAGWTRKTVNFVRCINTGTVTNTDSSSKFVGGIVGCVGGSCTANISATYNTAAISGGLYVGGLVGSSNSSSKLTVTNCFNEGNVTATNTATSTFAGGIVGSLYTDASLGQITNSWNNGVVTGGESSTDTDGLAGGTYATVGKVTNSYDLTNNGNYKASDADGYDSNWLTSGALCYLLNGDQSEIAWYETIGTDARPYLTCDGHAQVYYNGNVHCDGTAKSGGTYSNTSGEGVRDAHTYVNGFCSYCNELQEDWITPVDGYYELGTPQALVWFSALVNESQSDGTYSKTSASAKLTADIDMSDYDNFTPICSTYFLNVPYAHYYGTFDGQNNTISNLTIAASPAGLFGNVGKGAVIKNLTLDETCKVTGTGSQTGGFIGYCARYGDPDATTITLSNLTNKATVTGTASGTGGIVGRNWSGNESASGYASVAYTLHLENCRNEGTVTSTVGYVAGILGNPDVPIVGENLINTGDITGTTNVGGIFGITCQTTTLTGDVYNTGHITGTSQVGGIIGDTGTTLASLSMSNLSNSGAVDGTSSIGGIVGRFYKQGNGTLTLTQCTNSGALTASYNGNANVGGLVGWLRGESGNKVIAIGCVNTGNVTATASGGKQAAGLVGIAGANTTTEISNSYNLGNITASTYAAGLAVVGQSTSYATITNSWSNGSVSGVYTGGNSNSLCGTNGETANKSMVVTNSYDLTTEGATYGTPTGYATSWLASGEFTYTLNRGAGAQVYRQTIGTDATPVLDESHAYVNQITSAGYATMYVEEDITVPSGVTAYTGKVSGTRLVLTEIDGGAVPASTGVVLSGDAGFYSFMPTTGAAAVADNDLKGTATTLDLSGETDKYYVLLKPSDAEVGFYKVTDVVAAGKAYLQLSGDTNVKGFTFGAADGMELVQGSMFKVQGDEAVYDLSGRRVQKTQKGIYIIGGKKVMK